MNPNFILQYDARTSLIRSVEEFLDRGGVRNPDTFSPETEIIEALKVMNTKGYSQVPVCDHDKHLIGYLSWDVIFRNICKNNGCLNGTVSDFMSTKLDDRIISLNTPLRDALSRIREVEFLILVNDVTQLNVHGLVTVADLSNSYSSVLQGYIRISEIEHRLREILTKAQVTYTEARNLTKRTDILSINDLTLGNISYLFNNHTIWKRTSLCDYLDQTRFHSYLEIVRQIRNKIMHVDWSDEGMESDDDLATLARFLLLLN